ncbi:hypothetical protein M433DRAFT_208230 [Acidomyces richmondensis BFW]|nr:hypothetical protein M433DRAFT_208230 [Acidomyces richmondensis BFW]
MADAAAILGIVYLVISLIALVLGVLSTITSYASTADGYRRCKESIMGPWGRATHRIWTFDEFRLKVMFLSPVIFVARPSNTRGPIKGRPIFNVDGTEESYRQMRTRSPPEQEAYEKGTDGGEIPSRVSTVDDELASWVVLLQTLQRAEAEGRAWDHKVATATPKGAHFGEVRSTLVIQIQERKRSWDQMPANMQKPFATSTISHVAEMAALLGMVWTVINQDSWSLRAEGNGLVITSSSVSGLGIAVTFIVTGGSNFQANRTIPCHSAKEYLFGNVPTF